MIVCHHLFLAFLTSILTFFLITALSQSIDPSSLLHRLQDAQPRCRVGGRHWQRSGHHLSKIMFPSLVSVYV
ncbi:hypothetical protein HanIR_Chr14g0712321 [Helianthus annuus]|nr:hypothetical protein HanIR_Chr14g0712321 [Helianthus annuus]